MKKALKIISTVSILLFGILWITSKFDMLSNYNTVDTRTFFVLLYLFTNLKYFQMETKDKNAEIEKLKLQLDKINEN